MSRKFWGWFQKYTSIKCVKKSEVALSFRVASLFSTILMWYLGCIAVCLSTESLNGSLIFSRKAHEVVQRQSTWGAHHLVSGNHDPCLAWVFSTNSTGSYYVLIVHISFKWAT